MKRPGQAIEERVGAEQVQADPKAEEEYRNETKATGWEIYWPVIACGSGLFSDGFLNNIIGVFPPSAFRS